MKFLKYVVVSCMVLLAFCRTGVVMAAEPSSDVANLPDAEMMVPVEVDLLEDEDLESLCFGTRVVIPEGTKYYASADYQGCGPHGVIGNRYTPLGTDLYLGGFAQLSNDGRLNEYRGYNPKDVPVAAAWLHDSDHDVSWDDVWAEIFLDPEHPSPIGWVPARSIVVINGILGDGRSNQRFRYGIKVQPEGMEAETIDHLLPDPGNAIEDRVIHDQDASDNNGAEDPFISTREIAYAIEDYADKGERVALLLDASGSVLESMADIADYGEFVDKVNKAEIIVAFARQYKVIAAEEYTEVDVDGGSTDIYAAVNSLAEISDYDRIIIVTDTYHNVDGTSVKSQSGFTGKIVIVCTRGLDEIWRPTVQDIEGAFSTTVYLCRLNNELDRIRALEILTTK